MTTAKRDLLMALKKGHQEHISSIMASISPEEDVDSAANKPLHRAARYGRVGPVLMLIQEFRCSVQGINKFGMTPLHHAAVAGDKHVVQALLDHGANPDHRDLNGRGPLHWAGLYAHAEVAALLLQSGQIDVNGLDHEGFSALHRCCQSRPQSAEPEGDGREEDARKAATVRVFLEHGADVNIGDTHGWQRALHLAAMNGFAQVCECLGGSASIDVNAVNKISQTPLMYACKGDHPETVARLLQCPRLDVNIRDSIHFGWTAMHYAILQDNVVTVRLLIDAGFPADTLDSLGRSLLGVAEEHSKLNVLAYLRSRGLN